MTDRPLGSPTLAVRTHLVSEEVVRLVRRVLDVLQIRDVISCLLNQF